MIDPMDSITSSNEQLWKDVAKNRKKAIRKIFFTCLKELPKEDVVQMLKEKKIIKSDLNLKTNKLELMEVTSNLNKTKESKK